MGITISGEPATISVEQLSPNPWNPNRMTPELFEKEMESIRRFGFVVPLVARRLNGGFQILDGEHRWKAAQELGMAVVPTWVIDDINDAVAKQLTIVLNELRGQPEPRALGALLKDLVSDDGIEKDDLLQVLPFSDLAFDSLVGLGDFDWGRLAAPAAPEPAEKWVERIYRMPRDAVEVLDAAIARVKEENGDMPDWRALELIAAHFLS